MLLTNIELVPGRRVLRHLGLVQGSTVRAKHVGKDIMASDRIARIETLARDRGWMTTGATTLLAEVYRPLSSMKSGLGRSVDR